MENENWLEYIHSAISRRDIELVHGGGESKILRVFGIAEGATVEATLAEVVLSREQCERLAEALNSA